MTTSVTAARPTEGLNNLLILLLSRRNGPLESGTHKKIQISIWVKASCDCVLNTGKLRFKTPNNEGASDVFQKKGEQA